MYGQLNAATFESIALRQMMQRKILSVARDLRKRNALDGAAVNAAARHSNERAPGGNPGPKHGAMLTWNTSGELRRQRRNV